MSGAEDLALADHRSKFVLQARDLDPRLLSALRIDAVFLQLCDALVTVCSVLSDSSDPRPWQEQLDEVFRQVDAAQVMAGLEDIVENRSLEAADAWIRQVRTVGYRAFARRLVGAATYDRLERALYEDAAVVAFAVRRGVRAAMPFVVAWEDALAVMTPQQLSALTSFDVLGLNVGKLIYDLDALLGDKLLPAFPADVLALHRADVVNLSELRDTFRARVSSTAVRQLTRVNQSLVRKLAGARDALEHSADGVSQAASSLVELIDRVLRESSDQDSVLEWIDEEVADSPGLTWVDDQGQRRPTKRGEVLCLMYAGGSVKREATEHDDGLAPLFVHQILAGVVVSARTKLQQLKHADEATEEDREQLSALLSAIEGALMLGLLLQQVAPPRATAVEVLDRQPA